MISSSRQSDIRQKAFHDMEHNTGSVHFGACLHAPRQRYTQSFCRRACAAESHEIKCKPITSVPKELAHARDFIQKQLHGPPSLHALLVCCIHVITAIMAPESLSLASLCRQRLRHAYHSTTMETADIHST